MRFYTQQHQYYRGIDLHARKMYVCILQTIPGVGKILALVTLYEIHDIGRFHFVQDFSSYCRLIRPGKESNGKITGKGNKKIGNPHLKWAMSEATVLLIRQSGAGWGRATASY